MKFKISTNIYSCQLCCQLHILDVQSVTCASVVVLLLIVNKIDFICHITSVNELYCGRVNINSEINDVNELSCQ